MRRNSFYNKDIREESTFVNIQDQRENKEKWTVHLNGMPGGRLPKRLAILLAKKVEEDMGNVGDFGM